MIEKDERERVERKGDRKREKREHVKRSR